jgi:S1-C subfamily serine protease
MLQGTVSAKAAAQTSFGPNLVNTILFQAPIRNGFSGSPIFSRRGHVIGIQDTKVFGISPGLDKLRTKWTASRSSGAVLIMGIDVGGNFLEMINNLDQNLISGLGSGVDITYAKELQKASKH